MSSLAAHHTPNSNDNLLPSRPEHHFLCCWLLQPPPAWHLLPFPRSSSHLRLKKTTTRTLDCHGKHEPLLTSSPRNPQLSSLAKHRLKAPIFPRKTDEKCPNEHGLIQEAGFWTADGANTRRNRGTPPAPSSSDHEAATNRTSSSLAPRTRAAGRPPQLAPGTAWNPQCTRRALQTKPRALNPRLQQHRSAAASPPRAREPAAELRGPPASPAARGHARLRAP
jgi:hypothetical protein